MLDVNSLPQLFALYRVGLTFVVLRAAAARHRHRGRAAAARCPLAGLPAAGRGRLLDLVGRRGAGRRSRSPPTAGRRRQRQVRRAVPRSATSCCCSVLLAAAGVAGHDGAHHPGPGHEHAPGAAVHLVGAGRVARSAAGAAGAGRRPDLHLRRLPLRPRRLRRQPGDHRVDRLRVHPAGHASSSPSRCSASSPRSIAVASGRTAADAWCDLHRHRPGRHRRCARRRCCSSPPTCRATSATCRSATSSATWCRTRLFNLLPVLGGVHRARCSAPRRCAAAGRRLIAPLVFGLLGALHGVRRHRRPTRCYHVGDAQLAGTVFEEGTWLYVVYGAVLAALGAIAYWGPKLWGRAHPRQAGAAARRCSAFIGHRARLVAVPHRRVRRAAGRRRREFDYAGPQNLWNGARRCRSRADVASPCWPSSASRCGRSPRVPHAGDDPWDGQTLEWATSSPAPDDNFAEVHTVSSAEPLLDLKPTEGSPDARPALCSGARPASAAVRRHRARLRRRRIARRRMLALWLRFRDRGPRRRPALWVPEGHQGADGAGQHDAARLRPDLRVRPVGGVRRPARRPQPHRHWRSASSACSVWPSSTPRPSSTPG